MHSELSYLSELSTCKYFKRCTLLLLYYYK